MALLSKKPGGFCLPGFSFGLSAAFSGDQEAGEQEDDHRQKHRGWLSFLAVLCRVLCLGVHDNSLVVVEMTFATI